jgi:hypothetical protein
MPPSSCVPMARSKPLQEAQSTFLCRYSPCLSSTQTSFRPAEATHRNSSLESRQLPPLLALYNLPSEAQNVRIFLSLTISTETNLLHFSPLGYEASSESFTPHELQSTIPKAHAIFVAGILAMGIQADVLVVLTHYREGDDKHVLTEGFSTRYGPKVEHSQVASGSAMQSLTPYRCYSQSCRPLSCYT